MSVLKGTQQLSAIPVNLYSFAYHIDNDMEQALLVGAHKSIIKPIEPARLIIIIQKIESFFN